ncbi:MAG: YybH family protein [Leptolyngbyaceae cyanobacterium]
MSVSDRNQIQTIFEEIYPKNARSKDPQRYAAMFTKAAVQMPPGVPDRYGRADIAAGYAEQVADKDLDPTLTAEEIQVMGDHGYVTGIAMVTVHPSDGSPSLQLKFRGLWLMKKEDGDWKIDRQIWNEKPQ